MVNGILPSCSNSVANCQLSLKCRNANCTYLTIVHANFPHSKFIFSVGDCPTCRPRDWRLLMKCRISIKIKAREWLELTYDIWKNKIMCPKFSLFVSLFQLLPLDGSILRRSTRLLHDSSSSNEIAHDGRGYKRFHSSSLWWVWFSGDSWGLHFLVTTTNTIARRRPLLWKLREVRLTILICSDSSVSSSSGSGGSQDIDTEEEEETLEQQQLLSEAKYKVTIIRQSPVMDR